MGTTTDELRQQVDADRSSAEEKINKIQEQVLDSTQMIQEKATETVQQVKEQFDWRRQVNDRPLMAAGAAMIGGMMLGKMTSGGDHRSSGSTSGVSSGSSGSSSGIITGSLRSAFQRSGLTEQIESTMDGFFSNVASRMKDMTKNMTDMSGQDQSNRNSNTTNGTGKQADYVTGQTSRASGESSSPTI